MASYLLVATSSAHPGQDDAYNRWYDEVHLKDLLAIPGVKTGKRFEADPLSPPTEGRYLAVYEVETDDPAQVLGELARRSASGEMTVSPALDVANAKLWLYKAR